MNEKEYKKKEKEILDFFKAAFCVDGEVRVADIKYFKILGAVELNDSERGKFHVGLLQLKELDEI